MSKSAKKKNKSGNRSGVNENQCNVAMAAPSAGVSAYNFQAPETSTILNQANNVLYPLLDSCMSAVITTGSSSSL